MGKINLSTSNFEARDAWRLLLKILLFVPGILMVVAVNTRVDADHLYKKVFYPHKGAAEYSVAQALINGQTVHPRSIIDDRLMNKYFIEGITSAPEIVVLGTSRSMWLGENIFPDHTVINNSVLAGALPDYLGIFEGYAKKNLYPQRVILVLDPSLIGLPLMSERWLSIKEDTFGMLDRLGIHSEKIKQPLIEDTWFNIFSLSYFQQCMNILLNKQAPGFHIIFKDGRRVTGGRIQVWKTIDELVNKTNEKRIRQEKPDKELKDILENFIRYLTGHHIKVTLCLFPLHPVVYRNFIDMHERQGTVDIIGIEDYYRGLAQKLNLEIIGSFDPAACGLVGNDFYDGDHIKDNVIEKILRQRGSKCSMPGL